MQPSADRKEHEQRVGQHVIALAVGHVASSLVGRVWSFAVSRNTIPDMNAEAIQSMLRIQPFRPFEVHLSNGEVHEVRHQENAILMKSNLLLAYPEKDSFVFCALSHVANVQPLQRA